MSKISRQVSQLSGELATAPVEVPFAAGFNLEALRALDPEPVFATVEVKPGRGNGGKGPNYGPKLLENLAEQFNTKKPAGYKGHQDPAKVEFEYREPVTSWVGARWDPITETLYVKGYVPPTAADLRTQLLLAQAGADVVNSVSIFGMRQVQGDEVTNFDVWSLDWTPKGRSGMETKLVSVSGEMQEEDDVDRDEVIQSLKVEDLPDALVAQIRDETKATLEPAAQAVGEMKVLLELESEDPAAVLDAVRTLVSADKADELQSRVETSLQEVSGELMRTAIAERVVARLTPEATDEEIAGEIETAKELPHIKALAGNRIPVVTGGGGSNGGSGGDEKRRGTEWL